jgi:hypothetical protein
VRLCGARELARIFGVVGDKIGDPERRHDVDDAGRLVRIHQLPERIALATATEFVNGHCCVHHWSPLEEQCVSGIGCQAHIGDRQRDAQLQVGLQ